MELPLLLASHVRRGKLAHGYLLLGSLDTARAAVAEAVRGIWGGEGGAVSTDFHEISGALLGIGDAREMIRQAGLGSFYGQGKIFFLDAENMTAEASNALLKILEEASDGNYFFLRASSAERLIPTLRSRLIAITFFREDYAELTTVFEDFLKKSLAEKMSYIQKLSDGKDRKGMDNLIDACEVYLDSRLKQCKNTDERLALLRRLDAASFARELLASPAAYPKSALEYLAVSIL